MNDEKMPLKRMPVRMLVLISSPRLADKASEIMKSSHMPIYYQLRGQGTASSEMMDILGLGSTAKTVSISMMPKPFADNMLAHLQQELALDKTDSGIAFTTAITGISTPAMKLLDENIRKELQNSMENEIKQMALASNHSLIIAVVNQGYSEEVMDAAKEAGARGGTVLHARQMGGEEAMRFWGITVQEEKELVMILSDADAKLEIMKLIGEKCGMRSKAHGIVFSTPIDAIAGLVGGEA